MPETWYKVDNVAKVFLASINRRDPRVFRVSCTLNEDVDPDRLNQALEQTARENPQFQVTLHRGLFWHYFESTNLKPQAVPETLAPCAMLYGPQIKNELLYRVSYYGARTVPFLDEQLDAPMMFHFGEHDPGIPQADVELHRRLFDSYLAEGWRTLQVEGGRSVLAAYVWALKSSHAFNVLDARGAISVSQRAGMILNIRKLACAVAAQYVADVTAVPATGEARG